MVVMTVWIRGQNGRKLPELSRPIDRLCVWMSYVTLKVSKKDVRDHLIEILMWERRPLETEVKIENGNSFNRHFDEKR